MFSVLKLFCAGVLFLFSNCFLCESLFDEVFKLLIMSIANVKETDDLVQCPYDPAHRVRALRYNRHIIKCQRNSTSNLVPCPFNHQHRIPVNERAKHMIACPDRIVIERDVFRAKEVCGDCSLPPVRHPTIPIPSDEDWDSDCVPGVGPAYNPMQQMQKSQFHNSAILSSLKPADKRAYRTVLQSKRFGDEVDESGDCDSVSVLPILGLEKLVFADDEMKGFHPRPAHRNSTPEQQQMSSNVSELSGVTPRRKNAPFAKMVYDSAPQSFTSGPGSFRSGPQSFTSGPGSFSSGPRSFTSGPPSVISDTSSFNDNSTISDANSVKFRSSDSVKSSASSAVFSLRGRGRGRIFEKHISDTIQ